MAITLNDFKERLEAVDIDLVNQDFGHARQRVLDLIGILEHAGIVIHAVATTENKKVGNNDGEEN